MIYKKSAHFLWPTLLYSQELESRLCFQGSALKKASALAKSIKQNTSSVGQKIIKDDIKSLKYKQKDLENRIKTAKQETENGLNSILKSKSSAEKHVKFSLPAEEMLATCDVPEPTRESAAVGESQGGRETSTVSAVIVLSRHWVWDKESQIKHSDFLIKSSKDGLFTKLTCQKSPQKMVQISVVKYHCSVRSNVSHQFRLIILTDV